MQIQLGLVKALRWSARVDRDGDYATKELTVVVEPHASQLSALAQAMSMGVRFWVLLEGEEAQLPLDKALSELEVK